MNSSFEEQHKGRTGGGVGRRKGGGGGGESKTDLEKRRGEGGGGEERRRSRRMWEGRGEGEKIRIGSYCHCTGQCSCQCLQLCKGQELWENDLKGKCVNSIDSHAYHRVHSTESSLIESIMSPVIKEL